MIERMFGSFGVGDEIAWWADRDGVGVEPDATDAVRRVGVVTTVHRHPEDAERVVAYSVACSGAMGEYSLTVREDYGHRPVPA